MKILFIGPKFGNSLLLFKTIKNKFKNTQIIDTKNILPFPKINNKIFHHFSPIIFEKKINKKILINIKKKYDLIFVKSGEIIGKKLILELKKYSKKIIFFCNDNPFVNRDKNKWKLFLSSAMYYDVIAYQDISRVKLAEKLGLRNSLLVLPPYDSKIHKRYKMTLRERKRYKNKIIFVGTWFPERGKFLKKLIDKGLPIKIYGGRWEKDPFYEKLKDRITIGHFYDEKYSKLIQGAEMALCLFSKQNKDTITARSTEIPAIGTLLCSYRTNAMSKIFTEDKEAVFFSNVKECVNKCKYYLKNKSLAKKIALNGHVKITKKMKVSTHDLFKKIIKHRNI